MKSIKQRRSGGDEGFTLIELLIAIVVVGVLTAVVIIGVGSLTDNGETAACQTSMDAARAASAIHYSNNSGAYPADLSTMVAAGELELGSGVSVDATGDLTAVGSGWTLTMTAGSPPTFACS